MTSPMHSGPVVLNNIPQAVYNEYLAVNKHARQQSLARSPWMHISHLRTPEYTLTFSGLDMGEAEVLALAVELSARLVVIDERKGRRYAQRLGIPVTGTLGVLLAAKSRGLVDNVAPIIDILLENDFYLHPALVSRALKAAGESA